MDKGDRTKYGIFIGEVMGDRPQRITREEAEKVFDLLESREGVTIHPDPANPRNEFETTEEAYEGIVERLRDKAIFYQFVTDDGEKVLRPAEYGEPDVTEGAPPPPEPEPIPDTPQPELGRVLARDE